MNYLKEWKNYLKFYCKYLNSKRNDSRIEMERNLNRNKTIYRGLTGREKIETLFALCSSLQQLKTTTSTEMKEGIVKYDTFYLILWE